MGMEAESGRALRRLHAQCQEAHAMAERALSAFLVSALAHLRLQGRGPEAALWEAQAALGHEARWRAAGYLAGQLGMTAHGERRTADGAAPPHAAGPTPDAAQEEEAEHG